MDSTTPASGAESENNIIVKCEKITLLPYEVLTDAIIKNEKFEDCPFPNLTAMTQLGLAARRQV